MENNSKKEMSIDDLAVMVQNGFLGVEQKIGRIETDVKEIKEDIVEIKSDLGEIKADLNKKVDIFTHKDLEYRVEKLEDKTGIAKMKTAIA